MSVEKSLFQMTAATISNQLLEEDCLISSPSSKHATNVYQQDFYGVHIAKTMESAVYSKFM
jgi:hypothetical protein